MNNKKRKPTALNTSFAKYFSLCKQRTFTKIKGGKYPMGTHFPINKGPNPEKKLSMGLGLGPADFHTGFMRLEKFWVS